MKVILLRRLCLTSLLLLAVTGCRLLHTTTQLPGKAIDAITLGTKPAKTVDPVELQLQVQRFADDYSARTLQALDEYAQAVGTESARTEALQMKLDAASSLVSVASGQNPQANLLDLVAMVEIARLTAEDYQLRHPNGSAFQCWVETSRQLETNAWLWPIRCSLPRSLNSAAPFLIGIRRIPPCIHPSSCIRDSSRQPWSVTAQLAAPSPTS